MLRLPVEAFSAVFTKYPESLVRVVQVSGPLASLHLPLPIPGTCGLVLSSQVALKLCLSALSSHISGGPSPPFSCLHPFSPGFCHLIVGFSLARPLPLASPLLLPALTFPTLPPP